MRANHIVGRLPLIIGGVIVVEGVLELLGPLSPDFCTSLLLPSFLQVVGPTHLELFG